MSGSAQLALRRCQPTEVVESRDWVKARHYLGSAPAGQRVALEFSLDGSLVGVMLLGRPSSRELDAELWLELTRMHFIDDTPHSTESRALASMRKWVRTWMPRVKALLAYADPAVGHAGTVYLADGWAPFGRTSNSGAGWATRPGRVSGKPSRKLRWVRTP